MYGGYPPVGAPIGGSYPPMGAPPVGGAYGMAPPTVGYPPVGAPPLGGSYGMAPPQGGFAPQGPPSSFQGWFTVYYNMIQPHELLEITSWFQAIDKDRSGRISAQEIQSCTFGGIPLGFDLAQKLVRVFDVRRTGQIDFYEYAAMHKFLALMQQAFFAGDLKRNGRLDAREIHIALGVGHMTISYPAIESLYNFYNKDGYGCTFQDFLKMCTHIARAKSVFEWEDVGKTGTIAINFEKFLQMTGGL